MFLHVSDAKYIKDYKINIIFNNGRKGIVDLADSLDGPVFEPLKNTSLFSQVYVDKELETITWPNGADLAPEYLFFKTFQHEPELQAQFKEWGYC